MSSPVTALDRVVAADYLGEVADESDVAGKDRAGSVDLRTGSSPVMVSLPPSTRALASAASPPCAEGVADDDGVAGDAGNRQLVVAAEQCATAANLADVADKLLAFVALRRR